MRKTELTTEAAEHYQALSDSSVLLIKAYKGLAATAWIAAVLFACTCGWLWHEVQTQWRLSNNLVWETLHGTPEAAQAIARQISDSKLNSQRLSP